MVKTGSVKRKCKKNVKHKSVWKTGRWMTTYIKQRLGIAYSCEGGWKVMCLQLRKFRLLKGKFFVCFSKKKRKKQNPNQKVKNKGVLERSGSHTSW